MVSGAGTEAKFVPGGTHAPLSQEQIERRIAARKDARARKDFAEADRIRKELDAAGVLLEDSKAGTTWKRKG